MNALHILDAEIQRKNINHCNIEIRLHNSLPPFGLYMVDNWLAIGFYWHGRAASIGPYLEISKQSSTFGEHVVETFNEIWDSKTTEVWKDYKACELR